MASYNGKQWFQDNIEPFLVVIKGEINTLSSVTGQHVTGASTYALLPTTDNEGQPLKDGDITTLSADSIGTGTADSPQYPAGLYIYAGTTWGLLFEIPDIADILLNIMATDAEVVTGTATDKVASVAQLKTYYANINGADTELFAVAQADIGSTNALRADQFAGTVTQAEAQADWNAI